MFISEGSGRPTVLVTGADGFVGRVLCGHLIKAGYIVKGVVRCVDRGTVVPVNELIAVGDIGHAVNRPQLLSGVNTVVHLAARAHVMKEVARDPIAEYRKTNVKGTEYLAWAAARAGVRQFIYVSSIGVNGNQTREKPFTEADYPSPHDPYALSKWEAEQALRCISETTNLEVVVVRLPLVYGPGVKGNMLRLLHWVFRRVPLPLGAVNNSRSFINVQNVADILVRCIKSQQVAGETFLVSDGEDVSTPELIRRIGVALDRPVRLFPFPKAFLRVGAGLLGKNDMLDRLCGSLVVDPSKARRLLNWTPPTSMDEGLAQMARWYLEERTKRNV